VPFSLRARLTLAYGLSFAAILILIFVSLHRILGANLLADLDSELNTFTQDIAETVGRGGLDRQASVQKAVDLRIRSALFERPLFTYVTDRDGSVKATDRNTNVDRDKLRQLADEAIRTGEATSSSVQSNDGGSIRVRTVPIITRDGILGTVQAGRTEQSIENALSALERMLLIQGTLGAALALVIGYGVATQGLRPLKRVMAVAQRIHAGRLDERLNMSQGPREVVEVAATFDGMLGRIREQFDQQRKFVADVSHELRTPLTALQGNIDVLLLDPTLPADVAEQLRLVSAECSRLIRLATNLLYVAQAELDRPPDRREVDLHELCIEVFHQMRDIKPRVTVRLVHEDQARVIGDRDRLKQLLLNLVDNAIKYTPAGGTVSLGLHREAGVARIVVRDTGIGIPADKLEAIFQRFYTIDQRTDHTVKGAGLGLSIVEWVVKSHGGTIEVQSEPGTGSTFTVRLPSIESDLPPDDDLHESVEPSVPEAEEEVVTAG
jgi:heavy metal sensor kinase